MKHYVYVLFESLCHILLLLLYLTFVHTMSSMFVTVLTLIASIFSFTKIVFGAKLLYDMKLGARERKVVFDGVLNKDSLDFFYKISYYNLYFDDETMNRNYILFDDVFCDEISRGDIVVVKYFVCSRIIVSIELKKGALL